MVRAKDLNKVVVGCTNQIGISESPTKHARQHVSCRRCQWHPGKGDVYTQSIPLIHIYIYISYILPETNSSPWLKVLLGKNYQQKPLKLTASLPPENQWLEDSFPFRFRPFLRFCSGAYIREKTRLTPNRNPTYNNQYFVDILVLTIG